jgi:hypothetical protein
MKYVNRLGQYSFIISFLYNLLVSMIHHLDMQHIYIKIHPRDMAVLPLLAQACLMDLAYICVDKVAVKPCFETSLFPK